MKRILILAVLLVAGAVAASAQINNASSSGTVPVNVAQNATVVYSGYGSYTYPLAGSGVPAPYGGPVAKLWLVANQVKDLSFTGGSGELAGPGALYFTIHGERGSNIDVATSAISSNPAVADIGLDIWEFSDDGVAYNSLFDPNYIITYAGNSTVGPGTGNNGYIVIRFDAVVNAYATGTTTITATVSISNYSI